MVLRIVLPPRYHDGLVGDLEEDYRAECARGRLIGIWWLVRHVAGAIGAGVTLRVRNRPVRSPAPAHDTTHRRGDPALEILFRNLGYVLRSLRRQPAFTALVVFTLALGIGANTAIFSVVNGVLLRALPFPEPDRMVVVSETVGLDSENQVSTSYVTYQDYRDASTTLEKMGAATFATVVLTGDAEALRLQARFVSPSYLELQGAKPARGRIFDARDDEAPNAHPVAIISHGLWVRRFGEDPTVVGRTIELDSRPYTVIGVMSAEFTDLSSAQFAPDIWVPLMMSGHVLRPEWVENRLLRSFFLIGRLRMGETVERADQELQGIAAAIAERHPESNKNFGATVEGMRENVFGNLEAPLLALLVGAGFLLLVACANVGSLMLVRSANRRREITMRMALGASRGRLIQLLATESIVLGLAGGAIGIGLSTLFLDLLLGLNPVQLPSFTTFQLDAPVLAFSLTTSVVAGLLFGLPPALRSTRADLRASLASGSVRAGGDRAAGRTRNVLVGFEVATAVVLLVGSGLLIRSFQELRNTPTGFRTDRVLTLSLSLSSQQYPEGDQIYRLIHDLTERMNALPGVDWAGTWSPGVPGQSGTMTTVIPEGKVVQSQLDADIARFHQVSPSSMKGMELRLLAGRFIGAQDRVNTRPTVVISESLAEHFWPGENALGRRVRNFLPPGAAPADYPWYDVVGVVADANHAGRVSFGGLRSTYDMYFAHEHRAPRFNRGLTLLAGTTGNPLDLAASVRAAVRELDADLPVFRVRSMVDVVRQEEQLSQFTASLMGTFGGLSLFLAALGIYGVLSQTVAQREREIGLRLALGAGPGETARWFVSQGMRPVVIGVLVGVAGAFGLTRFVSSLLFGVQPTDGIAMTLAVALLMTVALIACYLPTRRAIRLDPMLALRAD